MARMKSDGGVVWAIRGTLVQPQPKYDDTHSFVSGEDGREVERVV